MSLKIGFFDSGIGGVDLYREFSSQYPLVEVDYISDLSYCPYGEKTPEQIQARARILTRALLQRGAEVIVLACNTATAHAINFLRQEFAIPFVGVEPYINYINFINAQGQTQIQNQDYQPGHFKPVVLLTQAMAQSNRFKILQEKVLGSDFQSKVHIFPCQGLADLVEVEWPQKQHSTTFKQQFEKILLPLKNQHYTHAILGCTHYPLIQKEIQDYLQVVCISPGPFIVKRIGEVIKEIAKSPVAQKPLPKDNSPDLNLHFHQITSVFQAAVTKEDPYFLDKIQTILRGPKFP